MSTTQGKRVESLEAVWTGEQGVYYPVIDDDTGKVTALWFKLPDERGYDNAGRLAAAGFGNGREPEWTITVEDDETVTVDPSIEQHEVVSEGKVTVPYWHGYLKRGVWEG